MYCGSAFLHPKCFVSLSSSFYTSFLNFLPNQENFWYWILSKSVEVFRVHQTRCMSKGSFVLMVFSWYEFASARTIKEFIHGLSLGLTLDTSRYIYLSSAPQPILLVQEQSKLHLILVGSEILYCNRKWKRMCFIILYMKDI